MTRTELKDKHIAIIGLGVEGAALAQFAAAHGAASISITDMAPAEKLKKYTDSLDHLAAPIQYYFAGNHSEVWLNKDILFVSPGITPGFAISLPGINEAVQSGAKVSNHTQLFLEWCPAKVIGVTGSSGKTTTTTLLGAMLQHGLDRKVYVGGNLGTSLLNEVDAMTADDVVVLELSEVQLARLSISPHIGVITNITPDHLDRYGTFERYVEAKRQLVKYMDSGDYAILNAGNIPSQESAEYTAAKSLFFSAKYSETAQAYAHEDALWIHWDNEAPQQLCAFADITLPGAHNRENILAAALAALLAGASIPALRETIQSFDGVRHRLEFVKEWRGVKFYDDSIATSPQRALAAVRAFSSPKLMILGGKNKDLPWEDFAEVIVRNVRAVALLGAAQPYIDSCIRAAQQRVIKEEQVLETICYVTTIEAAVSELAAIARPGDTLLLSPGCTSHDMFHDYGERAEHFIEAVQHLPEN